jgi:endonuclease/exonuclease/phosphatase (EEP) superfamily protein YafD
VLDWAERRGSLRLDWFASRGWRDGSGRTVRGLDGPGRASDHAPLIAEFA